MVDQKVGRNDPCWCGSGKKYKRCHGALTPEGESNIRAAIRIHTTPDGKAVPVLGWAPLEEEAWETIRQQLQWGQERGLLDPMDNPDHWEAAGVELRFSQLGPGLPKWSVKTALKQPESGNAVERPEASSLWSREWHVSLALADLVKWVEALQAWKAVVIAPYDPQSAEFLPFGFQIWVPAQNVVVEPWRQ